MNSSVHVDNKKKSIFILGEGPTWGWDGKTLTTEKNIYSTLLKIIRNLLFFKNFCLFVNVTESYKFKAKDSEIKAVPLCLGNISEDFSVDNMKKTGLNGYIYDFSADYDAVVVDDILDIHKYLMKKNNIKCLDLIKMFFYSNDIFWL